MYKDILVEEVRKRREKLASQFEFDSEKIFKMLKNREEKNKDKIASQILIAKRTKEVYVGK